MGCWIKTCGFSGLPICEGDSVYVFILEKHKSDYYNHCYTTSEYMPFLAPFESVYNGYGDGEDSGGVWFSYIMNALKNNLIEGEFGNNNHHDIAVKRENFNEALFFESVRDNRLSVELNDRFTYLSQERVIRYTMMNKSIIDKMLEEFVFDTYDFNPYKFSYIVSIIDEYWKETKEFWKKGKESSLSHFSNSIISNYISTNSFSECSKLIKIEQFLYECFTNNTEDSIVINLIKEYLKGIHVDIMMDSLRKTWIPGGLEGSQSREYGAYKLMIKVTSDHIKEKEEELAY